jgi:2-methylcitrate dehydratase PrpD
MSIETEIQSRDDVAYRVAFMDWLACAIGGRNEPAARGAREIGTDLHARVIAAGTAGHVLDFDDTYTPGLAHLTAPVAPAALMLGAKLGSSYGDVLAAYSAGFEAMGAVARASHPALYQRGWHPTAVCGVIGSATAAARLLGLDDAGTATAVQLALLRAGGFQASFGSDAKSLQVGFAAAAGTDAAFLAANGASAPLDRRVVKAFESTYGATWADPDQRDVAVNENWIKAYPCCLQTHSAIEAAASARGQGTTAEHGGVVTVHPLSRRAAPYDRVSTGLQAKFSLPYTVAFTLLHGPPGPDDFRSVDEAADLLGRGFIVRLDDGISESGALLDLNDGPSIHVDAALGSPARPMSEAQLSDKRHLLAGDAMDDLTDVQVPAMRIVEVAAL